MSVDSVAVSDDVLLGAVDLAREAAELESGSLGVGEYVGAHMEGERLATQRFTCTHAGYVGWEWVVVVARSDASAAPTVCDVVLMPGQQALRAPEWVPWSERVLPGDLGVGDVLPTPADDPRLAPGYTDLDALDGLGSPSPLHPGSWELGLGRVRVLSAHGRDEAAERWLASETGPESAMARAADLQCTTCGFLVTIGGALGQAFGICANLMSPADGAVVALDFGCGAHSEVEGQEAPAEDPDLTEVLQGDPGAQHRGDELPDEHPAPVEI